MAVTRFSSPAFFIRVRNSSNSSGSRSTAVIVQSLFRAIVMVCPPVPHPMSAIRIPGLSGTSSRARSVCSTPPGPCLSNPEEIGDHF